MHTDIAASNWSASLGHLSHINPFLLVALLLAGAFCTWLLLGSKSSSSPSKGIERKQWILLRDQDAEGIPVLAEHRAWRPSHKSKDPRLNPNYRRSDYE